MSGAGRLLDRLERASDLLSPIVVKEVRQIVRGREFVSAFGATLVAGLAIAFFSAADAVSGSGTAGRWAFGALMSCLAVLGLAIVPLGAFNALRIERLEQTLELITLTALTPRRVVIGKLLAQAVKLVTLFAAMAPFIAMSFLLGGIDFLTILLLLAILFIGSLWMSSAALFLSSLLKSRAMVGLAFAGGILVLFFVFGVGRGLMFYLSRGVFTLGPVFGIGFTDPWWALAALTTFCLATMVNLVLLAENRLALAAPNRVTPLRVGFLVQFLLIVAWALSFIKTPATVRPEAVMMLGVLGGLHLALVAMFAVTEDLVVARPPVGSRRRLLGPFYPGGGRGALYVLAQMAILMGAAWLLEPEPVLMRWLLAICGYICFFTGVPTIAVRALRPEGTASLRLRVAIFVLLPVSLLLPDILYYVLWRPEAMDLSYAARHLFNPIRTLANWPLVESVEWSTVPFALGVLGVLAYLGLSHLGRQVTVEMVSTAPQAARAEAGDPGSAGALY